MSRKEYIDNWATVAIVIAALAGLGYYLAPAPGEPLTVKSLIVPAIVTMYAASVIMYAVIWVISYFCRIPVGLSAGTLKNILLIRGKRCSLYTGIVPVCDIDIPTDLINKPGLNWTVTALPSVIMILGGLKIENLRDYFFETPDRLMPLLGIPYFTFFALLVLSCIAVGVILELLQNQKVMDAFPRLKMMYTMWTCTIIFFSIVIVRGQWDNILTMIFG